MASLGMRAQYLREYKHKLKMIDFLQLVLALLQTPIYFLSLQTLEEAPSLILEAKKKLPKK